MSTSKSKRKHDHEIDFTVTNDERYWIGVIAARAVKSANGPANNITGTIMDITAVHCNGNPLRLKELAHADDFNLLHDVLGIVRHLDRSTGKLTGHFSPRYSSNAPRATAKPARKRRA